MLKNFPHIQVLLKRLAIVYFIYFLCRLVFLVSNKVFYQLGVKQIVFSFYYGLLFDTSAIIYTLFIFILLHILPFDFRNKKAYQLFLKCYFILINGIAIFFNLVDTNYYSFIGRRSGIEILTMKNEMKGMLAINYLFDYFLTFLLFVFFIWLIFRLYKMTKVNQPNSGNIIVQYIIALVIIALSITGARGGFKLIPLNTFDAARLNGPESIALTTNTPFQIITSIQQRGLSEKKYFDENVSKKYFNPIKNGFQINETKTKTNVVLIIVESLGKEYMGYYNNAKGYTPFLDSLAQHSTVYNHMYSNTKRSIEGIPSILAAMPSWMESDYLSSFYQPNKLRSIGSYLKEIGYNCSFYHGGHNGTMSIDNFLAIADAGDYFGMNEYPEKEKGFDGNWGIYDDEYLDYWASELNKKPKPFFSTVFTLSSHNPYKIPERLENKFPKGSLAIHPTIAYADYSLKLFFDKIKTMPWYKNTVFLVIADHSAENENPKYQTPSGKFEIPFMIFNPSKNELNKQENNTHQQTDVLDIVLSLSNYKNNYYSFSDIHFKSINDDTTDAKNSFGYAIQFHENYYQIICWPYVYQYTGANPLGFYDLKNDELMKNNMLNSEMKKATRLRMDSTLKAVIQAYNYDLINNKTFVK